MPCSKPPWKMREAGAGRAGGWGWGAGAASALSSQSIYEEGCVSCTLGLRSPKPCPAFLLGRWRWPPGHSPHLPTCGHQHPVTGAHRVLPPLGGLTCRAAPSSQGLTGAGGGNQGLVKNGDHGGSIPPASPQGETSVRTRTAPRICAPSNGDTSKTHQNEFVRGSVC